MAAASYHPLILLIPKYGLKNSMKPLTANRGLPFAVKRSNLGLKVSNVSGGGGGGGGRMFLVFPLKFDNSYPNQNTQQNIKAKINDHLIQFQGLSSLSHKRQLLRLDLPTEGFAHVVVSNCTPLVILFLFR